LVSQTERNLFPFSFTYIASDRVRSD
jgi:hypothetical protein